MEMEENNYLFCFFMKHVFLRGIFVFLLLAVCLSPFFVFAQNIGTDLIKSAANEAGYGENTDEFTFASTLGLVIKALFSFIGIIFLSLMVYAGYLWMTARGKEDQVEKAQEIIRTSIIGLIIAVGAYSITSFIVPRILEKVVEGQPTSGGSENPVDEPGGGSSQDNDLEEEG
ncbi:MAG TPA: hypothetical protein DCY48_04580 [Candidatus Magasanikbacteria bacterium]|nr:MAG: hypothetical protein A3I74_02970 [Candidatus Magasanikbacteria bacterium RIFCSPLOWO2_02_FULL_47_16]OGH79547.1 MAG: hypothetical protein A3C10_00435 [Candidatus Magasanikbacteria bacterium RIFCSPHIGHO2_02_FULL_48_18]OGH83412.1 MAG: hypothetical protein A3G08_01100 [Candidatus Magasanikbacteria bacterium RIFCSPLOWO2_12_FULL_47_9b]HAZ29017.1 hypothetical protein [Candidatus Magasanikbacteria bacterium]